MNNTSTVLWRLVLLVTMLYWTWHLLGFELTVVVIGLHLIMILAGIADRIDFARKDDK